MASATRLLLQPTRVASHAQLFSNSFSVSFPTATISGANTMRFRGLSQGHGQRVLLSVCKLSAGSDGTVPAGEDDNEDGISLGTMKLPLDTDLDRFESLLFQWGNSLCQGANLPLPVPLRVDKIAGGARLGFITIGEGKTEVSVYIDCLVFPAAGGSPPLFRAIRNGPLRDMAPPGEPRIMRSLLQALQKSVEIARL